MSRTKKRGRRDGLQVAGGPFAAGVVPPSGRHATFGASRMGGGRLGEAVRSVGKKKPPKPKTTKRASDVSRPEKSGKKSAKKGKRKAQAPMPSASSVPGAPFTKPDPRPEPGHQRRAKTAEKKSKIKESGLDSRVRGHVSARGKRIQSRRDSKNG